MSTRTTGPGRHHLRTAAATVVAAAVAGTVVMPLSAYAAPAERKQPVLKLEMGAAVPSGPLTRGGDTETFELTVKNPSAQVASFHPWLIGRALGASPLQQEDVVYKVEAVDAPATESFIGQQDGEWQGMFHPAGRSNAGFEVPAGGKMSWKVTIGLGKSYPTNDGDFSLRATSYANEVAQDAQPSLTFKTDPSMTPGKLNTRMEAVGPCEAGGDATQCREVKLAYQQTGDGAFNSALATYLNASPEGGRSREAAPDLQMRILADGHWKDLKTDDPGNYRLPDIAKGFGSASGERVVRLQVRLGPKTDVKKLTRVALRADVGLATGNTYAFAGAETAFSLSPAKPATPAPGTTGPTPGKSPSPSATPSASPSATASATPSASATPAASGDTNHTTTSAGGSLANTGADSRTGLYSALAAALIALGGAAAWFGARRRSGTTGA
ncbi:hypothetical protein ABZX75_11140 [Streptomyces sp. NPDC003038]|uniref:hypothetical protein n=1 Tax=unclassified Streptomyces TaxID=2593676 RepID=UPI0033A102CE